MESCGNFPEELVEEILSRPPVKHLLSLRCVSKSWCALIDNYGFINKQHQAQYAIAREEGDIPFFLDDPSVLGWSRSIQFYLLSKKQGDVLLHLTPDLVRDSKPWLTNDMILSGSLRCIGVMNGVVALRGKSQRFLLWNPATREFKVVPFARPSLPDKVGESHGGILGMGLDPKCNDLKIVRSIHKVVDKGNEDHEIVFIYEIYSLNTDSWKNLEAQLPHDLWFDFSCGDGYFNGVYYWTACKYKRGEHHIPRYLILSFDFSLEEFKFFDPPNAIVMTGKRDWRWMVGQCMEQLALIFSRENKLERVYNFEIWVVGKTSDANTGTQLSWQHLFTIGLIPAFQYVSPSTSPALYNLSPKAFRMDGDVLLTIYQEEPLEEEWSLYNPSTQTFKKLGLSAFGNCFRYVESLFSLSKRRVWNIGVKHVSHQQALSGFEGLLQTSLV